MRRSACMLALLFPLSLPLTGFGKDLSSISETKQLCSDAVSLMAQDEVIAAFDHIRPYWPKSDKEQNQLALLTDQQMQTLVKSKGMPLGYEFLSTKTLGDRFVEQSFLQRYKDYAIRLVCVFYRGDKTWQLNTIYGDDQFTKMF